jgi:molybdenum cofactor sulfurtransferase
MKKESAEKLQRVFWGGSSVFTATSTVPWQVRFEDEAKWEDGTLPFLDIAALEPGFEAMERLGGIETVQEYVSALGAYMSLRLKSLQHSNGKPLLKLFGKHYECDMEKRNNGSEERQSSIANFHILKPNGDLFSYRTASRVFSAAKFHVRDGCMCNPGSCYMASGVRDEEIRDLAMSVDNYKNWEYINVERNGSQQTLPMGSIRVSLGWMSRKADIDALVTFLEATYKDKDSDPVLEPLAEQKGSLGLRC